MLSPTKLNRAQLIVFALIFAVLGAVLAYWSFADSVPNLVVGMHDERPLKITKDKDGKLHYSAQTVVFQVLDDNTLVCGDKSTPDILSTKQLTPAETDSIVKRVVAAGAKSEPDQLQGGKTRVSELTWIKVAGGGIDRTVHLFDSPQTNQFAQKVRVIAKDICKKANKQIERQQAPKVKQLSSIGIENPSEKAVAWMEQYFFPVVQAGSYNTTAEADQYSRINQARTSRGIAKLSASTCLRDVARRQADRMAASGSIFHNDKLGGEVNSACGGWNVIGENVGTGGTSGPIFQAFMDSALHRANILDYDYRSVGVGVSHDSKGIMYITQVFCARNNTVCGSTYSPSTSTSTTTTTSTTKSIGTNILYEGQVLREGYHMVSKDGRFRLAMRTDGNLVVLNSSGSVIWQSGTAGRGGTHVTMQSDGNFVMYGGSGAIWSTRTSGTSGRHVVIQTDGNAVLYGSNGALWSSFNGRAY